MTIEEDKSVSSDSSLSDDSDDSNIIILPSKKNDDLEDIDKFFQKYKN